MYLLLLIALLPFESILGEPTKSTMGFQEIDYEGVKNGLANDSIFLLGVRNPSELMEEGSIEKSSNIPLPELEEALDFDEEKFASTYGFKHLKFVDKPIVVYCKLGGRASKAASLIKSKLNLEDVQVYKGSFTDWVEKGGKVQKFEA